MSANRSITGAPLVPYQPRASHIEAAKHLRLTVSRYIADRASLDDIHEAVSLLVNVAPVSGENGYRESRNTMSNTAHYVVEMLIPFNGADMPAFVRSKLDWGGAWHTRSVSDAKTWKTVRGAQRWIEEHPELEAFVSVVRAS